MAPDGSIDDVLVIGAGPAGLATSACLRRDGVAHRVIDAGPGIGASWQRHDDRLHLHTTTTGSALPMTPWSAAAPRYPSRDEVVRYLRDYAAVHAVAPRFEVEVHAVAPSGDRIAVETSQGRLTPRRVVVATGCNRLPCRPMLPGLPRFAGPVLHSSDYRHPAPFRGLRTLVVGCGNSGAEIALDLADQGVEVDLVVRGPVHVVPRDLFGHPTQHTAIALSRLPLAWRDALALALLRVAVGDLSRRGIVRPASGPNRLIEETGRSPWLDVGTVGAIRAGRIGVRPGVVEVLPSTVRFADGRTEPVDAIVLATGYDSGLHALVEGFDAIADARGRPPAAAAGLHFIGFTTPATGALREIAREAPRVARAIRDRVGR